MEMEAVQQVRSPPPPPQVTLLASGRLMYSGPRDGMVDWFGSRGYHYDAALHGVASDWALDLVAIGFHKPKRFYGHTITTREQLHSISAAFVARYREKAGLKCEPLSPVHAHLSFHDQLAGLGGKLRGAMRRSSAGGALAHGNAVIHAHAVTGAGSADDGKEEQLEPASAPMWATGWWSQYVACLGRELLAVTRNPADVAGRTLTFSWVALLMGLLYFNMPMGSTSRMPRPSCTAHTPTMPPR